MIKMRAEARTQEIEKINKKRKKIILESGNASDYVCITCGCAFEALTFPLCSMCLWG